MSNTKDNPPCSTLFVGNLGDQVSEQELIALFSAQPGFVTLKVVRSAKTATAFVDFSDLAAAMAVHDSQQVFFGLSLESDQSALTCQDKHDHVVSMTGNGWGLQGAILQSSDRGGIRIQYSKNPFGKKRDHQGNPVDPTALPPAKPGRLGRCRG